MQYPALDVVGVNGDLLLALVDDFSPTAVEEHSSALTIYFTDSRARDAARRAIGAAHPTATVTTRDVDDEDWARRSQANLTPVTVGSLTITPLVEHPSNLSNSTLVITPSMGFGTGHHATTRLCLLALQHLDLTGLRVLDVGTGSGVLAMAARLLGAQNARGIDSDADAIGSALDNLRDNPRLDGVSFEVRDLRDEPLAKADVVVANLTGALLVRSAAALTASVNPGGGLILSGLQVDERTAVIEAYAGCDFAWQAEQDGWVGLIGRPRG